MPLRPGSTASRTSTGCARWSGHRLEGDATIRVSHHLDVTAAHDIADEVKHAVPYVEAIVVHIHPVDAPEGELHELTGHHASAEDWQQYLERQAATSS